MSTSTNDSCWPYNPTRAMQHEMKRLRARVAELEKDKAILLAPLVEMVEAIESGDEAGRGSEWHILARQAIDNARE